MRCRVRRGFGDDDDDDPPNERFRREPPPPEEEEEGGSSMDRSRDLAEGLSGTYLAHVVPSSYQKASLKRRRGGSARWACNPRRHRPYAGKQCRRQFHGARTQPPGAHAESREEDNVEAGPEDGHGDDTNEPVPEAHDNPTKKRKLEHLMDPGCTGDDPPNPQLKSEGAKDPENDDSEPKEDATRDPARRMHPPRTGLRHLVCNKIRLAGHRYYFDERPCPLIVPVLDLEATKGWNGQGYRTVVVNGGRPPRDRPARARGSSDGVLLRSVDGVEGCRPRGTGGTRAPAAGAGGPRDGALADAPVPKLGYVTRLDESARNGLTKLRTPDGLRWCRREGRRGLPSLLRPWRAARRSFGFDG
jgi:hypothetical protein